jgi:hypothetical protein
MRRLAPAAAGSLALALFVTAPVWLDPRGTVLGHPGADTYNHLWGYWQVATALGDGESPLHTLLLRFPEGGALWFIDMFGALVSAPLQALAGPAVALNTVVTLRVALAALGAGLLAYQVTGSRAGAAVAGVIYGASPYALGQIHNGITETLALGWLPLTLWGALRFRADPGRRSGLLAGVLLAITALTNWYYGLFAVLALLPLVLQALGPGLRARAIRPHLVWPVAAAGVLVLPALWAFRGTLVAADGLVSRDADFVERTLWAHNMVDALAFWVPIQSPNLKALFDEDLVVIVYAGLVALCLAAWGAWRRRAARPWLVGAGVAWVMALGPYLYVGGRYQALPGGDWLPLPFLFFFEPFPLLRPLSHAYRFTVPLQLCVAVLAAWGVTALAVRLGRSERAVALVAGALITAELALLSPAPFPVSTAPARVPVVYSAIPQDGAVLDLPVSLQVLARSRYNLYQIGHGRPIPYGLNDPTPPLFQVNRLARSAVDLERTSVDTVAPDLPALDLALGEAALVHAGFAAVVLHLQDASPAVRTRLWQHLDLTLGPGRRIGDQVIWVLGERSDR